MSAHESGRAGILRWYGGTPLHLIALVGGSALSAYAVTRVPSLKDLVAIGVWFVGTLLVHDLVLFPVYAAVDNVGAWARRRGTTPATVPWVNHVRVPAVWSGLLLLAWFPLVLRLSSKYEPAAARSDDLFLSRWLLVTAVLFLGSALIYAARIAQARRRVTASGMSAAQEP